MYDNVPLLPFLKRVHPMGFEFGPDGNLYVMVNQFFAKQKNLSIVYSFENCTF